jgi:Tol biopolymer transport system component
MNKITKRIFRVIFAFILIVFLLPPNVFIIKAATNATVYEYSPMLEDGGNIYYILRVEGDTYSYDIYKLEIATGNKTRLLSSKNDILSMMLHKDTLYYNCFDGEKDVYQTYSVSIDAKEKRLFVTATS